MCVCVCVVNNYHLFIDLKAIINGLLLNLVRLNAIQSVNSNFISLWEHNYEELAPKIYITSDDKAIPCCMVVLYLFETHTHTHTHTYIHIYNIYVSKDG